MSRQSRPLGIVAAIVSVHVAVLGACAGADGGSTEAVVQSELCRVDLHGKGEHGSEAVLDDGIAVLRPDGNGEGWGGREWRYGSEAEMGDATAIVRAAVDASGCERVAIHGFSNGAAFAAALVCSGESLGGRLAGVVIDDPVTDAATVGCRAAESVDVVVYWTGALDEQAPPGTDCADLDWTCAGGRVRGIDAFATDLGVVVSPSPFDDHSRYDDAPEPARWLAAA